MRPRLSLVLPAVPGGVPRARDAVTDLCERLGLEHGLADDVRLAVTEACTNCVLHSHVLGEAPHPTFVLDAHLDDDELVVVVRDFGAGFARTSASGAGLGLGMQLIERVCESSQVSSRPGGGTRVAMHFDIPPERARVPAVVNSLRLGADEVGVVRGLQSGTNHRASDDPVWSALKDAGLVRRKGRDVHVWTLTMRGRLYRTD
jgi:serine/threonine-protein kinase RsbW